MTEEEISCLPVVETVEYGKPGEMRLAGIVTWKDVARAFCPASTDPVPEKESDPDATDEFTPAESERGVRALLREQIEKIRDNSRRLHTLREEQRRRDSQLLRGA